MSIQFLLSVSKKVRELKRNEKLTRALLESLKLKKFRRLVNHASEHSPYYARIINDCGIDLNSCSPEDFPVLTKTELMANFDEIVTDRRITKKSITEFLNRSTDPIEMFLNQYYVLHTSGSSGELGYFVYSKKEWACGSAQSGWGRLRSPAKIGFRRPRIAYFAVTTGHFGGAAFNKMGQHGFLKLFVKMSLLDVNAPLVESVGYLNEFQPDFLHGYASSLRLLAEKQIAGELQISPISISTGGETQTDADRKLFTTAFDCPITNAYGSTEHLIMGASSSDHKTMTLYDDDLIYEFHKDHTNVTNLFNFTLPLIRYYMSDVLAPIKDDRSAEPYLKIKNLVGRSESPAIFLNQDGTEDAISQFTVIELFIPGVRRFQMRISDNQHFTFAICLDHGSDESQTQAAISATQTKLEGMLSLKLMSNVDFDIVVVDEIPPNNITGKFQLIVKA